MVAVNKAEHSVCAAEVRTEVKMVESAQVKRERARERRRECKVNGSDKLEEKC